MTCSIWFFSGAILKSYLKLIYAIPKMRPCELYATIFAGICSISLYKSKLWALKVC